MCGTPGEGGLYLAILILLAIAGIFTIGGGQNWEIASNKNLILHFSWEVSLQNMISGLSAVIWTDFAQTILMILGAFVLMITAMVRSEMQNQYNAFVGQF